MSATVLKITDGESLSKAAALAAEYLLGGKLVVFPTETVYGIGCNALDPSAVERLYYAKKRPFDKPLLLHLHSVKQAMEYSVLDARSKALLERFTPGPLSVIVRKKENVPSIVTSGGDTVGLRFPDEPFFLSMAREAGIPIAATSANLSGFTSAKDGNAAAELKDVADLIIDHGTCAFSLESTILSLAGQRPKLLREGAISKEKLLEVLSVCD